MTSLICGATFVAFLLLFGAVCSRSGGGSTGAGYSAGARRVAASAGPCGFCGQHSKMLSAHEAGHVVAAKGLGYRVTGAVVRRDGTGETYIPGWLNNPEHTMIIAAAGAAGENRDRWTDAGLNGSPSTTWSDAWWVHKLAPQVARRKGVSVEQVIGSTRSKAARLVASNSGEWSSAKATLSRDGEL